MASKRKKSFSISELAKEFGITTRAIRFYEEKGLLQPERNGQSRIYSAADRVKLILILRGKRLGLLLEESRDIIEMYAPNQDNSHQLQKLIDKIREKRIQLKDQLNDLNTMMQELEEAETRCLGALNDSAATPQKSASR
ncbi:MAG: DNA-binding transcriptional MerR regulator [Bermanella sp.]|jgi:DNA-binding transcriptional MerR regulator